MKKNIVIIVLAAFALMSQIPTKPKTLTFISDDLYKASAFIQDFSGLGFSVVTVIAQPVAIGHLSERSKGKILVVMQK